MNKLKELIAEVKLNEIIEHYGDVKREVYLSAERINHIVEHHPSDYDQFKDFIAEAIEHPDVVLDESKNPMTAMFVKKINTTGINVIVKLALATDMRDRSFVVTMHAIGEKRLKRLKKTNIVIYNSVK